MEILDPDAARAAWRAAESFADLCELGACFLEDQLAFCPGWGASRTDEETDGIAELLAGANRAGFLTLASQPGAGEVAAADGRVEKRRAFVCGFADPPAALALEGLAGEGLIVASHGARESGGEGLTVGLRGTEAFLVVSGGAGPEELEIFAEHLSAGALEELGRTRYVSLIDPDWGRRDRLWGQLAAVLPHPHQGPSHSRPPRGVAPQILRRRSPSDPPKV